MMFAYKPSRQELFGEVLGALRQRQKNPLSLALLRLDKPVATSSEAGPILQVSPGLKIAQVAWSRCDHGKPRLAPEWAFRAPGGGDR